MGLILLIASSFTLPPSLRYYLSWQRYPTKGETYSGAKAIGSGFVFFFSRKGTEEEGYPSKAPRVGWLRSFWFLLEGKWCCKRRCFFFLPGLGYWKIQELRPWLKDGKEKLSNKSGLKPKGRREKKISTCTVISLTKVSVEPD